MAERKFAALANLRQREPDPSPPDEPPPPKAPPVAAALEPLAAPPAIQVLTPVPPEPQKGRGRPPGKRSDPDWAPRTILMRSKTHRRVSIMLLERDDGPDLSELVDELLTEWVSRQS
jgi:hypothetical protein